MAVWCGSRISSPTHKQANRENQSSTQSTISSIFLQIHRCNPFSRYRNAQYATALNSRGTTRDRYVSSSGRSAPTCLHSTHLIHSFENHRIRIAWISKEKSLLVFSYIAAFGRWLASNRALFARLSFVLVYVFPYSSGRSPGMYLRSFSQIGDSSMHAPLHLVHDLLYNMPYFFWLARFLRSLSYRFRSAPSSVEMVLTMLAIFLW